MDEIEARVTALEGQMTTRVGALENQVKAIREDAAAARVLAGGADRDVSEFHAKLDAHKGLIEALRQTQIEQGRTLAEHGRTLAEHGAKLDSMQETLAGHSASFEQLAAGQAVITDLLTRHLGEPGD